MKDTSFKEPFFKVNHFGIVVKNLGKTTEHLESLGIGPFKPLSLPPFTEGLLFRSEPLYSEQKVALAKVGDVYLELFEPVTGQSPWQEFLDSKGEGLHHIGFAVDNIDREATKFAGLGFNILHSARWEGNGGCAYLDLGTGGIIIELLKM